MKPLPQPIQPDVSITKEVPILFVRSEGRLMKMDVDKIWFVEGLKDYVRFWTDTGKIIVHSTMKNIEEQLSGKPAFVRISKSYIVNLMFVTEVDGNTVRIKDQSIAIGNTLQGRSASALQPVQAAMILWYSGKIATFSDRQIAQIKLLNTGDLLL